MRQQRNRPRPQDAAPSADGAVWLYGLHAVSAAIANPARRLRRLLVTRGAEQELAERFSPPWRIVPEPVERARLDGLLPPDAIHQGAALLVEPLPSPHMEKLLEQTSGPVLVLDQVTDPRNVGAILRSAAAFGAAALVVQERHAPSETGALARAASGALEVVPILREVNLARALEQLKKAGLWVVGLEAAGQITLAQSGLTGRRVAAVTAEVRPHVEAQLAAGEWVRG